MASVHLNGNNVYFQIDDTPMSPDWIEGSIAASSDSQEVTAGSGRKFKQRKSGLQDRSFSGVFQWNEVSMAKTIKRLKPGTHSVIIGPEGNATGMPKHEGEFEIESSEIGGQNVNKGPVNISISGNAADDPIVDIFDGGVF